MSNEIIIPKQYMRGGTEALGASTELPSDSENKIIVTKSFELSANIIESLFKYTTAGSYVWTAPSYATKIRVALCGGGGGTCIVFEEGDDSWSKHATDGGTSFFDSIAVASATGGVGGKVRAYGHSDDNGYHSSFSGTPGDGGTPNGNSGIFTSAIPAFSRDPSKSRYVYGGAGFELSFNQKEGTYGKSGYSYHPYNARHQGCGVASGGSGGYLIKELTVVPNKEYKIQVGGAGTNLQLRNGTSGNVCTDYPPTSGFVLIEIL